MLHRHGGHAEAVARIRWCISETALGVITGEVGAGKTVALRAALAGLDASRHTVIYLPNPAVGARGLYAALVSGLGGIPRFHTAALIAQTMDHLAAEKHERGRAVIVAVDEAHLLTADQLEELEAAHQQRDGQRRPVHRAAARPAHPASADQTRRLRRPRPADRAALRPARHDRTRDPGLPHPPPQTRRSSRPAVLRRRRRADPPDQPRPAPRGQQHRPASPRRQLRGEQDHRRRVRRPRRRRRSHRRLARDHDATLNISTPARPRRPRPNPRAGPSPSPHSRSQRDAKLLILDDVQQWPALGVIADTCLWISSSRSVFFFTAWVSSVFSRSRALMSSVLRSVCTAISEAMESARLAAISRAAA